MNLNNVRDGVLKDVFDALEEAFQATGVEFYLLGAQAKDNWYALDNKTSRLTNDIDFAVLVSSQENYEAVKNYLADNKAFRPTGSNAFAMLSPAGTVVDILPFGGISIDDGVKMVGQGLANIRVDGFKEVFDAGTEPLTMTTGHRFKTATLPAIVLLKLIAYDDRPEVRLKDASDIASILKNFFDLQSNLVYERHVDLFEDDSGSLEDISAIVIGREIQIIMRLNAALESRILKILEGHISQAEESAFVREMVRGTNTTIEEQVKLLALLRRALE